MLLATTVLDSVDDGGNPLTDIQGGTVKQSKSRILSNTSPFIFDGTTAVVTRGPDRASPTAQQHTG